MARKRWLKWTVFILTVLVALAVLSLVAEKSSPGLVMRPIRTLAAKAGIDIPWRMPTAEESARARLVAMEWKAEALEIFPVLEITPHPLPDDQNAFLMLWELDQGEGVSSEFQDLLRNLDDYDSDAAKHHLEAHQNFVHHIERIASMPSRSSMNMPDGFNGFIGVRKIKQAFDTLMLKARLTADEGDELETLRCVRLAGNLADHLAKIETPFLLSETAVVLFDLARYETAFNTLLPKLGPNCDLYAWQAELNRLGEHSPQRFAKLLRGEWHIGADHMAFFVIAQASLTGEFRDGKGCAMAYSKWMADQVTEFENKQTWTDADFTSPNETFEHLTSEQRNLMSVLAIGSNAWGRGYIRAARVTAKCRAALQLLILERDGNEITFADTARITLDPISGAPFTFNPETRTLTSPELPGHDNIDPITLPW